MRYYTNQRGNCEICGVTGRTSFLFDLKTRTLKCHSSEYWLARCKL